MEELLALIYQEMEVSGLMSQLGAGIVLTGGASLIPGCVELAEEIFQMPVRLGYPLNVGGLKDVINNPKYATAVGLLVYGAEQEDSHGRDPIEPENDTEDGLFQRIWNSMKRWFGDVR